MTDVSKFDDVIDSRDVIARIEELESERDELAVAFAEAMTEYEGIETNGIPDNDEEAARRECGRRRPGGLYGLARRFGETAASGQARRDEACDAVKEANEALADWDNGTEGEELAALKALAEEASGYAADWHLGETLIHDSYFEKYAQQLADDLGAVPNDASWPLTHIDWKQAASELQQDYTSVDFDGETFWVRS